MPAPARGRALALAALCACATSAAMASATLDLLERPAPPTVHGQRKLLLAIARAGARLVAVGELGLVLASDDEGRHWQQALSPTSTMLTCVAFVDAAHGWAAGHDGVILATTDGGRTWRRQFDGREANAQMLAAAREQDAAAWALPGAGETPVRAREQARERLADAEAATAAGPSRPLLGLLFTDAAHGLAAGAFGQLFETSDGGARWRYIGDRLPGDGGLHLNAVARSAAGTLYIAAEAGTVFRSTDGGRHWTRSATGYAGQLFGVMPLAAHDVLAYGFGGHLFRSTDDGATWTPVPGPLARSLVQGARLPDGGVLLVSQDGRAMLSHDAARHFATLPVQWPLARTSSLALAPDGRRAIVVGLGGIASIDLAAAP